MASQGSENFFTLQELRQLTGLSLEELQARMEKGTLKGRRLRRTFVSTQNEVLDFLDREGFRREAVAPQNWFADFFDRITATPNRRLSAALALSVIMNVVLFAILGPCFDVGNRLETFQKSRHLVFSLELTTSLPGLAEEPLRGENGSVEKANRAPPRVEKPEETRESSQATAPVAKALEPNPQQIVPAKTSEPEANSVAPAESTASRLQGVQASSAQPSNAGSEIAADAGKLRGEPNGVLGSGIAGAQPGPYRPGSGVMPPRLIHKVPPHYPEAARAAGIQGAVELEIIVKADGSVGNIKVLRVPRKEMGFEEAAINAVRQWKFLPGAYMGTPVEVIAEVAVNFKIEN